MITFNPNIHVKKGVFNLSANVYKSLHKIIFAALLVSIINSTTVFAAGKGLQQPLANPEQVQKALDTFKLWTQYFQQEEYREQFKLVHPQKRKHPQRMTRKAWGKTMKLSLRKNGRLLNYQVIASDAITAAEVPCSEMGHCFRKGLQLVAIVVSSEYEKTGKIPKEYIVMANSENGWRYAGGNFLNYFLGETDLIFSRQDERRYQHKSIKVR